MLDDDRSREIKSLKMQLHARRGTVVDYARFPGDLNLHDFAGTSGGLDYTQNVPLLLKHR